MKIVIETVKHTDQRYDTVGDWVIEGQEIRIKVSELGDWRYEALVGLHELVELLYCSAQGISGKTVDDFDMSHPDAEEPGNLEDCPYREQHEFATAIEMLTAKALGVDWVRYEKRLEELER